MKLPRVTRAKAATIRRLYGLEVEQFLALYRAAEGRCQLCRRPFDSRRTVHVEHEHRSGMVRGLACSRENHDLLGVFGEDPEFYQRVADYLRHPPAVAVLGTHLVPDAPPPRRGKSSDGAEAPEP